MKKNLLILIASLFLCGSIFGQYESHWPEINAHQFNHPSSHFDIFAAVSIDDNMIMPEDNYLAYEVAFFVGDELRGKSFLNYYDGDAYPMTDFAPIHLYEGEEGSNASVVSCRLFDHENQHEYTIFTSEPTIMTGVDYSDWDNPVMIHFSTPTFPKPISGYGNTMTAGNYFLIASPIGEVSPTDVINMVDGAYDLYYFDQAQELEWINYKGTSGNYNLEVGKGYLYANSETLDLTFRGFPYEGTGVVTLSKNLGNNTQGNLEGWNLVGNPFAETAYIVDGRPFYVMNADGNELMTATNTSIEAMEGIFVEAASDGETMEFAPGSSKATFNRVILDLSKGNGNVIDRAIVRFGNGSVLHKFQISESNTKIYLPQNGENYAVLNVSEDGQTPVNFKASENGDYSLVVTPENVDIEYLHLIDNITGADVDLLVDPKYSFKASTDDIASRFTLRFRNGCVNVNETFCPIIFRQNGDLSISGIQGESEIQIVDMLGRVISTESVNISGDVVRHINTTPGVYVVRLINNNNIYTQKIVVE